MPRAPTTTDVFNAIAEPRRREIIDLLARGPDQGEAVSTLVVGLGITQPAVSKHLAVLRKVGIVAVSKRGRERIYRLNAGELKPVHDWVKSFEQYWVAHLDRIKQRAEQLAREQAAKSKKSSDPKAS